MTHYVSEKKRKRLQDHLNVQRQLLSSKNFLESCEVTTPSIYLEIKNITIYYWIATTEEMVLLDMGKRKQTKLLENLTNKPQ